MNEETQASQAEPVVEATTQPEAEKTATEDTAVESDKSKELQSALAQKDHYRTKLEKETQARKELEDKLNKLTKTGAQATLDVEDYIDISASLDGLDQREKERLAKEHKLTGRPLREIRQDEDFVLWQQAYRNKVEKERKALTPTPTQAETQREKSFAEKLREAKNIEEKEALLAAAGMTPRFRRNPNAGKIRLG